MALPDRWMWWDRDAVSYLSSLMYDAVRRTKGRVCARPGMAKGAVGGSTASLRDLCREMA